MADKDNIQNTTGTDLEVLQSLEQSFKRANPQSVRRNTAKSLDWFRKMVTKNYKQVRTARMFRDRDLWKQYATAKPGRMYYYEYKAETVDFYDRYPLMFVMDKYKHKGHSYMIGFNLHWLSPVHRMAVMRTILTLRSEKRFRKNTRVDLEWEVLKKLSNHKLFEHCIRVYRAERIKSVMVEIPAQSWELSLFLPTARFVGGSKQQAWQL